MFVTINKSFAMFRSSQNLQSIMQRFQSTACAKLVYEEYGEPLKVIKQHSEELSDIGADEIIVKMLAAPINPADINTIEGKYPSKPKLPAVPGNEGVGKVLQVGCGVQDLKAGDHIIPLTNNFGTWQTHMKIKTREVLKVPNELSVVQAATLKVNPCTAYRMLKDFVNLNKGDVVIQNGGNSTVGQNVIQLARIWGLRTVNIVRNRDGINELKCYLKGLGATEVLTEEEARTTDLFKSKKLPRPKLAFNCVGGKSALEILRTLEVSSPIVTYGGMSREPFAVPTSALIFKDVKVVGFWMSAWYQKYGDCPERTAMFNELIGFMMNKEIVEPLHKMVDFSKYQVALTSAANFSGKSGAKYILQFSDGNCE